MVDAAWYRARYPDVAAAGADPAEHYRLYGRAEGRHPSADREPRALWRTRFDAAWYLARNADLGAYADDPLEHFVRIGLLEGRAANAAEEDRAAWRGILDADWYRERNPDVARLDLDPLEHFITTGLIDRRRPNAATPLPSQPVTETPIARLKGDAFAGETALFVTHAPDGAVRPHVGHHLACLKCCGIASVLIVVYDRDGAPVTGEAVGLADHVFRRGNAGFDFAAWAHVLRLHPELYASPVLYLANDSVLGPTSLDALARVVARIRASEADLVGLTDNADRGWHVQSYFLALKRGFAGSAAARSFFDAIVSYGHKNDVVNEYETRLARHALDHGFRAEVLFPTPDWLDATLHNWRRLLRAGFPYLKVGTARGLVPGVETVGWREALADRGYDTGPADRTLARLSAEARERIAPFGDGDLGRARARRAAMHDFLADGTVLALPAAAEPLAAFVCVLDGRPQDLLALVRALAAGFPAAAAFMLVDNAAIDDTGEVLGRLHGAAVVTNVAPLPRLRAARQAVARTRAPVVVLLRPGHGIAGDAPAAEAAGPALAAVLDAFARAGDGLAFAERAAPEGCPCRAFAVTGADGPLGAAYAFLRADASAVLTVLAGADDPTATGSACPDGVL